MADVFVTLENMELYKALYDDQIGYTGDGRLLMPEEREKLASIEEGAEVNAIDSITVNNEAVVVTDGVANIDLSAYAELTDIVSGATYRGIVDAFVNLPSDPELGDVYQVTDEDSDNGIWAGEFVIWDGSAWQDLGGDPSIDMSEYYSKDEMDAQFEASADLEQDLIDAGFTKSDDIDTSELISRDDMSATYITQSDASAVYAPLENLDELYAIKDYERASEYDIDALFDIEFTVPPPVISYVRDGSTATITITPSTVIAGAGIYYTIDNTAPDTYGILYTGPFDVNASNGLTIRAIYRLDGYPDSAEASVILSAIELDFVEFEEQFIAETVQETMADVVSQLAALGTSASRRYVQTDNLYFALYFDTPGTGQGLPYEPFQSWSTTASGDDSVLFIKQTFTNYVTSSGYTLNGSVFIGIARQGRINYTAGAIVSPSFTCWGMSTKESENTSTSTLTFSKDGVSRTITSMSIGGSFSGTVTLTLNNNGGVTALTGYDVILDNLQNPDGSNCYYVIGGTRYYL